MPKTALVTGGSSGLGLELARLLSERGYVPVLLARNQERIEAALAGLRRGGREAVGYSCDVTDERRQREVCAQVKEYCPVLDILVVNAGSVTVRLLSDFENSGAMKQDLETNLWGAILTAHTYLPLLQAGSKVLVISSGFGLMGPAGYSVYAASKAGLINFAESLRRELLRRRVTVHVACPGDMETPQFFEECRAMPEWMRRKTPRSSMSPRAAAEIILDRCRGKRFLVFVGGEIRALDLLNRLAPRRFRDFLIDRMFPLPPPPKDGALQ